MNNTRFHRFSTFLLVIVLIAVLGLANTGYSEKTFRTPTSKFRAPSLKPFIRKIDKNYGSAYATKVKELFDIFLYAEEANIPEEETSFLEFNVLKMKVVDNKTLAVKINTGDAIRVKDTVKISFTPRRECFLYLFRVKATGIIFPLFPRRKFTAQTNPLSPHLTYFVPPMKKWLPFGRDFGKGAIIVFASTQRNHDIEKLMEYFTNPDTLEKLTRQKEVSTLSEIPIINRGIGGVKESEIRKIRLPFDELGEFVSTEFAWNEPIVVLTLWYKCG
ncbi:MAG: hypothetical protein SCALA701_23660 [Candidatus Scalindua sp.]|nr:DUF4384 domain-containing protein [Planctomycetota bacterium]GJQ59565.1 MAG: hypothetical protein SCALA701_23660 [Candidatus Scalindua sp.]